MKKLLFLLIFAISITTVNACTNLLVTKGASANGSAYILYTNDGEWLYHLQKYPAMDYPEGEYLKIGNGKIKQVRHTYARLGFHINEFQVVLAKLPLRAEKNFGRKTTF